MTSFRIVFTALLPFAMGYFMSYLLRAVNAVVAPDLVRDAGLSPAQLGLLTAAYLGAFALFQLPLGVLLDRYGPRKVQAGLLTLAAIGCLWFAWAPGFAGLFAARALIGLGFSAGLMAGYKSSATWVPLSRRSLANTAIMSVGALGVVVATEPTEFLVSLIGWRNVFAAFAGLIMLTAVLIFAVTPRDDVAAASPPLAIQFAQMTAILKRPLFWRVAPLVALTSGVQIGIQTLWAGPWFRDVMGLSRDEVARHLLWMAVTFMAGIFLIGVVTDRLGKRGIGPMQVMLSCYLVCFVAQTIIVFRMGALMFPAWLAMAACGQVAVLSYPWFAAHIGSGLAGRSNATINFALFVAAFAAQYVVGFVIGLFPQTATGYDPRGYSWGIGMFLLLQIVAYIWYLLASPHREPIHD